MTDWAWVGVGAGGAVALLIAAVVGFRLAGIRVVGPMFWYELVKLARRGQQPRLRVLLVALLLVGLLVTYLQEFRGLEYEALLDGTQLPINRTAQFGETFLITFAVAQLAAVILITPAVVGGAISEEKERGSLDFLRSTMLTNREIILGKLAARLAFVFGVVLAGVPVLALTTFFGGVDPSRLFGSYVIVAMTCVSLGAFSLLMGVLRDGLREVLVWVYGVTLGLSMAGLCCGCIPGLAALSPPSALLYLFVGPASDPGDPYFWVNIGVFVLLHGIAAGVCTVVAVRRVRAAPAVYRRAPAPRRVPRRRPGPDDPLPVARRAPEKKPAETRWRYYVEEDEDDWEDVPLPRARRHFEVNRLRPDADPFLWKERYFSGRLSWVEGGFVSGCGIAVLSAVVFGLGLVVFFTTLHELDRGKWTGEAVNGPLRVFVVGGVLALGLAVGARAAGGVARERERQTLDGLLTLPVPRARILRGKAFAPLIWARYGFLMLGLALAVGLATKGLHPLGFVAATFQSAGSLVLLAAVGTWLSVRCRTVTRATVFFILWVLVLWLGPLAAAPLATVFADAVSTMAWGDTVGDLVLRMSPPVGVWNGLFGWEEYASIHDPRLWTTVAGCIGAGVLYVLLGLLLAADAVRAFEKVGK